MMCGRNRLTEEDFSKAVEKFQAVENDPDQNPLLVLGGILEARLALSPPADQQKNCVEFWQSMVSSVNHSPGVQKELNLKEALIIISAHLRLQDESVPTGDDEVFVTNES